MQVGTDLASILQVKRTPGVFWDFNPFGKAGCEMTVKLVAYGTF